VGTSDPSKVDCSIRNHAFETPDINTLIKTEGKLRVDQLKTRDMINTEYSKHSSIGEEPNRRMERSCICDKTVMLEQQRKASLAESIQYEAKRSSE
jgi:hypothetical protein